MSKTTKSSGMPVAEFFKLVQAIYPGVVSISKVGTARYSDSTVVYGVNASWIGSLPNHRDVDWGDLARYPEFSYKWVDDPDIKQDYGMVARFAERYFRDSQWDTTDSDGRPLTLVGQLPNGRWIASNGTFWDKCQVYAENTFDL